MIAWKVAHEAITMKPAPLHGETTTPEQAARDRAKKTEAYRNVTETTDLKITS